jgi:hypothetical protein
MGVSFSPEHAVPAGILALHERNLEEVLLRGLTGLDKEGGRKQVHVRHFPHFLQVCMMGLRRTEELQSLSARSRLVLKIGAEVLANLPSVRTAVGQHAQVINEFDAVVAIGFRTKATYAFSAPVLSLNPHSTEAQIDACSDAADTIDSMVEALMLPRAPLTVLGVIAGLSRSIEWIAEKNRLILEKELQSFEKWVASTTSDRTGRLDVWQDQFGATPLPILE